MEDICIRIPTLAEKIFQNLGNQDLIKLKENSRDICSFLNEERFFAMRIINAHFGNFVVYQDSWNKVIEKAQKGIITQLAKAGHQFFMEDFSRFEKQWPPFWIAAANGNRQLCKHIIGWILWFARGTQNGCKEGLIRSM